ncbi:glyoxalase [uncultured Algoriphagus sp.]|uniref:glyoxalase n=1 Tax=uncultured Algoriphagus sp. TaxID=417365 RepID=UPI0030EC81AB|tara:strand:- start:24490 stop:24864 length:375 start_codon:yes stop_codon:yes gene_type:complete
MIHPAKSIRTFIGAKDYAESIRFYQILGFNVRSVSPAMSVVTVKENIVFYLQDAYVKAWCENSMIFLEIDGDLESYWEAIKVFGLPDKFPGTKLSEIQRNDWGNEFFLHDPAGNLWHFGVFKTA